MVQPSQAVEWREMAQAAGFMVLVALILYIPTVSFGFLSDDFERLDVALTKAEQGPAAFFTEPARDGYYRPLFYASLWLDSWIWGLDPRGFHATNLALHLVVLCVGLLLLARFLIPTTGLPRGRRTVLLTLVGFALAVYPHHMDAVSWISDRSDLLFGLFSLGSLAVFLASGPGRVGHWAPLLAPVLLALAILSKESAVAFPVVLVGVWAVSRRSSPRTWSLLLCFGVTLALVGWRLFQFRDMGLQRLPGPSSVWLTGPLTSTAWGLLPIDREWVAWHLGSGPQRSLLWMAVTAVSLLCLGVVFARARRSRTIAAAGVSFAVLTLALPALGGPEARYLYVPAFGLVPPLIAVLFVPYLSNPRFRLRSASLAARVGLLVGIALLAGLVLASSARRAAWSEASVITARFMEDLSTAAERTPASRPVVVLAAPFTVRGASVAGDWEKALSVLEDVERTVRIWSWLRVPSARWQGPVVEELPAGQFELRVEPGPHTGFLYPGDASGDTVRIHEATAHVIRDRGSGRTHAVRIDPDPGALDEGTQLVRYPAPG